MKIYSIQKSLQVWFLLMLTLIQMVSEVFGDILVCATSESLQEFPSPESLKGRVVISTKPPKEYLETEEKDDGSNKVHKSSEAAAWGKEISDLAVKFDQEDGENEDEDENYGSEQNAAPKYKELIAIRNEKMRGGIKAWLRVNSQKAHRVSLNEEKLEKAAPTHGTEIVR